MFYEAVNLDAREGGAGSAYIHTCVRRDGDVYAAREREGEAAGHTEV